MTRININGGDNKKPKGKHLHNDPLGPDYGYKLTGGHVTADNRRVGQKRTYTNPHGLGETFGRTPIEGVNDLLFGGKSPVGGFTLSNNPLTADQAMYQFERLASQPGGANRLAAIQQKLYLSGLYTGKYVPRPGLYTDEDRKAFKKLLLGLAASPGQGKIGDYLDQAAQSGQDVGAGSDGGSGTLRQHAPLAVKLTNTQDIANVANAVAFELHGTYLDPTQLQAFTDGFHNLESQYQTNKYQTTGFNPATGQEDPGFDGAPGGVVPQLEAPPDLELALKQRVREANPTQFAANTFTDRLGTLLSAATVNSTAPRLT